jgi:serine/threonine-protein kinase
MAKKDEGGARGLPPLPTAPRRTLVGVSEEAPNGWLAPPSAPPLPPPSREPPTPPSSGARSLPRISSPSITYKAEAPAAAVDAAWDDDDKEDEVTHLFGITDVDEEDEPFEDEKTRPLPSPEEDETREIPKLPANRRAVPAAGARPSPVNYDETVVELNVPRERRSQPGRSSRAAAPPAPPSAPPAPERQVEFPGAVRSHRPPIPARLANPPSSPPPRPAPAAPARRERTPPRGAQMPPMGSTPNAWAPRASSPDLAAASQPGRKQVTAMHARPRAPLSWRTMLAVPIAGGLVAIAFATLPGQGRILVNVADARGGPVKSIEVFVDGEKATCATAPCYLACEPGAHEVKVMSRGFEVPASQAVAVKAGDSAAVQFTLSTGGGSGIKVGGTQPGVKLFVDSKEMGPLPQIIRDLVPGDHVIRVAGSQRYQAIDRHVIVEPDKVLDLGSIALKVVKGYVTVNPGTQGARVFMVSGGDRRELTMLPISLDIETTTTWSLEASKTGFEDYHQAISFDDGLAEKAYTVMLEPKGTATPSAPVAQAPPAEAPPAPAPQAPPPPAPVAASPSPPPAAASGGGEAYLNINSIPPSTCVLDGRPLGSTPRLHVVVRSGTHRVTFRSPEGATKTVTVNVGPGETRLAATRLDDE